MENNENTNLSLRDAIEAGFERVGAEEAAAATAAEETPEETVTGNVETATETSTQGTPELETQQTETETPTSTPQINNSQQHSNPNEMLATAIQMLRASREENARLSQMISQQGAAMNQQSQMAEQAAMDSMAKPEAIPAIDFSQLQYMGDEERTAAVNAWQNAIMEQAAAKVRAEFAPVKADYEAKSRMAAESAAKNAIFSDPRFSDFTNNSADIERIAASEIFKNATPEQKYLYSGLIARGMHYDPAAKPSTDDIVKMAMENPDALKAIETRRAQEIRDKNADLPVLSGSSGMSGANPVPQNKVKTREELEARMMKRFGL